MGQIYDVTGRKCPQWIVYVSELRTSVRKALSLYAYEAFLSAGLSDNITSQKLSVCVSVC